MIAFCLSIHHLWGRTLAKHYQDVCAVAYADDGYIKVKLSVALEVHRLVTADPSLAHLGPLLAPKAFVDDCYIELGVPIGTDSFVQHFVKKKCQEIMEDVDKLDNIQDGFIHYQLMRFCQATRLQYLNGQIDVRKSNRPPAAAC